MTMTSTTAVQSLMEIGRQRGCLDIDDIRGALPVDTMSIEDLSDVLAHLEEAGIPVEIDSVLLTPRDLKNKLRQVSSTEPSQRNELTMMAQDRSTKLASSIKGASENSARAPESVNPYVYNSGTVFVISAALILILLALVVWRFI